MIYSFQNGNNAPVNRRIPIRNEKMAKLQISYVTENHKPRNDNDLRKSLHPEKSAFFCFFLLKVCTSADFSASIEARHRSARTSSSSFLIPHNEKKKMLTHSSQFLLDLVYSVAGTNPNPRRSGGTRSTFPLLLPQQFKTGYSSAYRRLRILIDNLSARWQFTSLFSNDTFSRVAHEAKK